MEKNKIFDQIVILLKEIFDEMDMDIAINTKAEEISDWDSLTHVRIMILLQETFGIELSMDEMAELNEVNKLVEIVYQKKIKQ